MITYSRKVSVQMLLVWLRLVFKQIKWFIVKLITFQQALCSYLRGGWEKCERNSSSDTNINEEGRGGDGTRCHCRLWRRSWWRKLKQPTKGQCGRYPCCSLQRIQRRVMCPEGRCNLWRSHTGADSQ